MRLKLIFLVFAIILTKYRADSQESFNANKCYALWKQDTLVAGNSVIQVKFIKSPRGLGILTFQNSKLQEQINFYRNSSLFTLGSLTNSSELISYKAEFIAETPVAYGHLLIELINAYPTLDVKRQIRIYPGSPMIAFDFLVKSKSGKFEFTPEEGELLSIYAKGNHWAMNAVEFYDRTDKINTLVKEHKLLSFRYPEKLPGNLLFATDLLNKNTLIIVKEAPCSFVQLQYPGYDFKCLNGNISVCGIGIANNEISTKGWVRSYSVALGISGVNELETLSTLRSYQDKIRRVIPERDEMVMMNTWGDRNQDGSINETFIKNEIDACKKLNITHFQIDDGWQQGRSHNSADSKGSLWDKWGKADWQPDSLKFPNGFNVVNEYAKEKGIKLGLWFHPTNENSYATWERDAQIIIGLYKDYGIRYFKIDGVKLPNKLADTNFRKFLDMVSVASNYSVVFNLDLTADNRGGYNYIYEYGNMFLENRYTDWGNYYPFWTLRNVWMLSKYIPTHKLQVEFLNPERNADKYPKGDVYAPSHIPFDFQFATTMVAQPLAWFEGSNLSDKSYEIAPLIKQYVAIQAGLHSGQVFPLGDEPSGSSWTGFQSIVDDKSGYILVFRENNEVLQKEVRTYLQANKSFKFQKVLGYGNDFEQKTGKEGTVNFSIPGINQFVLYKYLSN